MAVFICCLLSALAAAAAARILFTPLAVLIFSRRLRRKYLNFTRAALRHSRKYKLTHVYFFAHTILFARSLSVSLLCLALASDSFVMRGSSARERAKMIILSMHTHSKVQK
jgi:hypothetical protein